MTKPKSPFLNYVVPLVQSEGDKIRILASIPRTYRVMILEKGKDTAIYKVVSEVIEGDVVVLGKRSKKPIVVRGRPGRPREGQKPLETASKEVTEANMRREEFLCADSMVRSARRNSDSPDLLHEVVSRLTESAASITFERKEAERLGKEVSAIARREIAALTAVRDASLRRMDQRLRKQEIDLESLAFRNLFVYLVQTFSQAMSQDGLKGDEIDSIIARLSKEVDTEEWKASALKSIQGTAMMH